MASTYLTRTSTSGSRRIGTFSAWVKRGSLTTLNTLLDCYTSFEQNWFNIRFSAGDQIQAIGYDYTTGSFQEQFELRPSRLFRDTNAWYHIVFSWDSTQATPSNRIKIYVNGVQETSFAVSNYPSQNEDFYINYNSIPYWIGRGGWNSNYFNGSMSHVHIIDGTAYDASAFGETDSTTGEWKIKTSPSVTYGTNGAFILKDGNSVTDQSGNGNNFTVASGTLTKTEDNPSNVFATANPLDVMKQSGGIYQPTFSNGNLTISCNSATNYQTFGTIAVDTGKYYWETKATDVNGHRVGVFFGDNKVHSGTYYYGANAFYIHQNGQIYYNGANTVYMSSLSDGDIVGVALDRTNGHIYLHKNGQYADGNGNNDQTFANAVSISTKLGVTMPSDITYPFFDVYGTSAVMDINFGNGYFGTTAVSSAGTNASGNGIFEYDVPTGYTALSTKGLNE